MAECLCQDDERGDCIGEELTVKTQSGTQGGSFLFGRFIQLHCGII